MHHALLPMAVDETEGVPQFVYRLLQEAIEQQILVRGKTIHLGSEAVERYHCRPPAQLRLAEHVGQDRCAEVHAGDSENRAIICREIVEQKSQEGPRAVLPPCGVKRRLGIEPRRQVVDGDVEIPLERFAEPAEQVSPVTGIDRHQVEPRHGSLLPQPVFLDLVVESHPIDAENLCGPGDIPTRPLQDELDVCSLDG